MVSRKDMDLSQGYKMTSPTVGDVQSGASLVYAGSLSTYVDTGICAMEAWYLDSLSLFKSQPGILKS